MVGPLAWTTVLRLTGYCFVLKARPVVGARPPPALAAVMNARAFAEDALTPAGITADNACVYVTLSDPVAP